MTTRTATAQNFADQTTNRLHVLIAGAGIGGLTLALALAKQNITSHVFERRERFTPEGAGIQVGPNGARILIALGLEAAISAFAGTPTAVVPRDGQTGDILSRMPLGRGNNANHTAPYWTMHRANLHAALCAAIHDSPHIRLTLGADVLRAEQASEDVAIILDNHDVVRGTVFVAADGCHSRFRKAWISDRPLTAVGKGAARAVIPAAQVPNTIDLNAVGLWLAPGAHVVHYPVRAGRDVALVAIFDDDDVSPDWTTPISQDWVLSRSSGLHRDLRDMLQTGTSWQKWSLTTTPPLSRWSTGRTTLLGDAAHPILPFLAQGAVMAMEDAVVLASSLARAPEDVVRALQRYEAARRPRCKRVAKASLRNGRIYHQSGVTAAIRNRTMKALGGQTLINRYRWLYGWRTDT